MDVNEAAAEYLPEAVPQTGAEDTPPGYKRTEVGVIPEDWELGTLSRLLVQPATYGVVKAGRFQAKGVPMVRGGDIKDGRIEAKNLPCISNDKNNEYKRTMLRCGDVLIALVGYPGETALVGEELENANISRAVGLLRPNREVLAGFLVCYLNSEIGRAEFLKPGAGSAQLVVNLKDLNDLLVPLPPTKAGQHAIAEALSDADALIAALQRLIAKKRAIKQGTMQALLTGRQRLPGFTGEWGTKPLAQLADIRSGGTPATNQPAFWNGDVAWCTPTDITALRGYKYLRSTARRISQLGLNASSAELLPAHSIVMTSRATIGECAINLAPVTTNQGFKNLVPHSDVDVEYLYYLLLTQTSGFIGLCGGSTFLEIGKRQLAAYEVTLPAATKEQTAIATVLSDMDAEIEALEVRLAKTRQLKAGMMQQLLTGRVRLVEPDTAVQSAC